MVLLRKARQEKKARNLHEEFVSDCFMVHVDESHIATRTTKGCVIIRVENESLILLS